MRKVLRSLYLDQQIDEALAARAATERTTKADLMREYIAAGLELPARALTSNTKGAAFAATARAVAAGASSAPAGRTGPRNAVSARARPASSVENDDDDVVATLAED